MKTLKLPVLLSENLIEAIGATILVRLAKEFPSIGPSVWVCFGLVAVVVVIIAVLDEWVAQGYKVTNLYLLGLSIAHVVSILFGLLVGLFV